MVKKKNLIKQGVFLSKENKKVTFNKVFCLALRKQEFKDIKLSSKNLNFKLLTNKVVRKKTIQRKKVFNYNEYKFYWFTFYTNVINKLMWAGRKNYVERKFLELLKYLKYFFNRNPFFIFFEFLEIIKICFFLAKKRRGRQYIKIPIPLNFNKRYTKPLADICVYCKGIFSRANNQSFFEKLLQEIFLILVYRSLNSRLFVEHNKKIDLMEENKAYMHFRWK